MLATLALAGPTVVAVLPFEVHSTEPALQPLGAALSDMLITDLHGADGLVVVERARLMAVLDELSLQHSDWADPTTAAQLGRGVGADLVVTGSLTDAAAGLRLDARWVDVATATITGTAKAEGSHAELFPLETQVADQLLQELGLSARVRVGGVVGLSGSALTPQEVTDAYRAAAWRKIGEGGAYWVADGFGEAQTGRHIATELQHTEVLAEMEALRVRGRRRARLQGISALGMGVGAGLLYRRYSVTEGSPSLTSAVFLTVCGTLVGLNTIPTRRHAEQQERYPSVWYGPREIHEALEAHNQAVAATVGLPEAERRRIDAED